jgi:dolichyl-phosphate-mannose-protein mannosyltransferase
MARRVVVLGLMLLHAGILLDSARKNFVTVDEAGHIVAGISHWETGTFCMYRVNPPLPRMLAVLPVLAAEPDTHSIQPADAPGVRSEWPAAWNFAADNADRYVQLVFLARLAGIGWSLVGAWVVYCWARELFGDLSGYLALALWCVEPNILAWAGVLTADLPATVAGLAATYAFWQYLCRPSWPRALLAGFSLGVALLTKFTLLVLFGVWPALWLCFLLWPPGSSPSPLHLSRQVGQILSISLVALLIVNLGYGFDGTCQRLGDYQFISQAFTGEIEERPSGQEISHWGNRFRGLMLGSLPVPGPAEYLQGIDAQMRDFERQPPSYLAGVWQRGGWWYYYLYALAVKVPVGVLVLVAFSLPMFVIRRARWREELVLWTPVVAVLGLVSSQMGFNHHMRYVLPIFPFVLIGISKLAPLCQARRFAAALLAVLLLWTAASSLRIHPHYLSYFNEIGGGPDNGHAHLVDSNIDWGQDLLFLKAWLEAHPEARPLKLAYYNFVDPCVIGIEFALPPFGPPGRCPEDADKGQAHGPQPGYFAVSVNYVRGSSLLPTWDGRGKLVAIPPEGYGYFRRFRPIAKAGYSIFIYHITPAEANPVRQELGLFPLATERGLP